MDWVFKRCMSLSIASFCSADISLNKAKKELKGIWTSKSVKGLMATKEYLSESFNIFTKSLMNIAIVELWRPVLSNNSLLVNKGTALSFPCNLI